MTHLRWTETRLLNDACVGRIANSGLNHGWMLTGRAFWMRDAVAGLMELEVVASQNLVSVWGSE